MIVSSFPDYVARFNQFIAHCGTCCKPGPAPPEITRTFEALALQLFELQCEHNPRYGNFCRAKGAGPGKLTVAAEIPAVPTAVFKEVDFTCVAPTDRVAVFHSSGTTGQQPSRHFHSALSLGVYETSILAGFQSRCAADLAGCAFLFLTPPPGAAPHSSLVHMFEVLRRGYGLPEKSFFALTDRDNSWTLELSRLTAFLLRAVRLETPVFLLGTAFSFVHLLDHLTACGEAIPLAPGSRVMETGGYKSRSRAMPKRELHSLITRWLGIQPEAILCEYGMSELSSQAYDAPSNRLFRFVPWARASVVSPETGREVGEGEAGIVRILDLANIASVLAVDTQDLAIRRGNCFELVGRCGDAEPRGCSLMPSES